MSQPLPAIPDKHYFTIGEASYLCQLKTHVLRYWEQEFTQLRPNKRRGNRRYYQHQDIVLIRHIRHLLYERGFTINGARQQLIQEAQTRKAQQKTIDCTDIIADTICELETLLENIAS